MGKRQKRPSTSDDAVTTKREEPLQAVLLADSFNDSFLPVCLDRPKVLCPLNNVTLIDYAMDFLAGAGVEELFVVCVSDPVEAHVQQQQQNATATSNTTTSSWTAAASTMQVTVIKDSFVTNAGDALRELDNRNLVQSDIFILMFGDVVTNVDLTEALAAHKKRHSADRSAMMTVLMKQVGASQLKSGSASLTYSSIRSNTEDLIVGLDPSNENRILVYDDKSCNKSVSIPCSFFASHPAIDMRCDLMDCGIYICSPDVLARFSDEFYGAIRREFVANSVAEEEEGLQNKIYCHFLKAAEYAARVHDFLTYAAISRDLLRRWCYPVVPDNLKKSNYRYVMQRHYMYHERKDGKTRIGRSTTVRGAGMIGSSCFIGEDCRIEGSVIGNHCHVGSNATIQGSHVWDCVEIGSGSVVVQSVLADGCVIKKGAVVGRGCIVGAGCVVGQNVVLPEFTRLTTAAEKQDDSDDDWDDDDDDESKEESKGSSENDEKGSQADAVITDKAVVGPDGKGRVWLPSPEDEEDDDDMLDGLSPKQLMEAQSIGFDSSELYRSRIQLQQEEEDSFSDEDDEDALGKLESNLGDYSDGAITFGVSGETAGASQVIGRQKGVDVVKELKSICLEYEPTTPIDNLAIELNSFKFSQNATYSDCTMAATLAILDNMNINKNTTDGKLVADFKSYLDQWAGLLQKMSIGTAEEKSILAALEQSAVGGGEIGDVLSTGMSFRLLLQTLHDEEIVGEEAILSWAAERRADDDSESPVGRLFRLQPIQDFVEWLEEESAEEDDDDSGDEADSDEE